LAILTAAGAQAQSSLPTREPPPPARYEPIPPSPAEGMDWQPGHWRMLGGTWIWSRGRWAERPFPGARWARAGWERRSFGWVFLPGRWEGPPDEVDPFAMDGF
jgi:hypothetical protein